MSVTLRAADEGDLDAIMALERASFPTDAWSAAMMREELRGRHSHYIVLHRSGQLVGYAGLRAPRGAQDADVQTIAVAAPERGRGFGRRLLTALLDEAAGRGVREVFLEVRADNPAAQELYRSEGFTEAGRRPRYYQPDDVDAVVMRLDVPGWAHARATLRSGDAENASPTAAEWDGRDEKGPNRSSGADRAAFWHADSDTGASSEAGACT